MTSLVNLLTSHTMKALDVSKAIISLYPPELEEISNLKLQKLLYYVQGFNLAIFDEPLFDDKIYAWQYGPVVKTVYDEYKIKGAGGIVLEDDDFDIKSVLKKKKQRDLLKEVNDIYGQFSAIKLMNMTHSEPPWKNTNMNEEISHKKLREYFRTRIS